jgi:hypothetical protein
MSSPFRRPALFGRVVPALSAAAVLLLAGRGPAQAPKPEDATFNTADGVELKGTFYPSAKGKSAPVALLLHKFGSDHTKGDWDKLAKKLQSSDKNFAVLAFDFRGHGASTSVNGDFWKQQYNLQYIKGANAKKTAINYKDFNANYFPYLVNDLAAARHYIDQRNDAMECNAGNIFVIGAQESAALGMLWLAHEWQRQSAPGAQARKGGQDIAGVIWLSGLSKGPHGHALPYPSMMQRSPDLRDKTPMCFFYGETDNLGRGEATYFFNNVLKANVPGPNGQKPSLDFKVGVKGTSLAGIDLLKSPKADELINENIDKVMGQRGGGAVWANRKVDEMRFEPVPLGYFGIQ